MCVKNFFGILVVLTSVFCVSCVPVKTQKPKPASFQQAFVVKRSLGISSAKQLDGASVCLITGGKEEIMVSDYFKKNSMSYESVTTETNSESRAAYLAGRCDVMIVNDLDTLNSFPTPSNHTVINFK